MTKDLKSGDKVFIEDKEVVFIDVLGRTLNSVTRVIVEELGARYIVPLYMIKR